MDPQSLNGYSYVRDNPLKFIYPTGESWTIWDSIAAGLLIDMGILATIPTLGVSDALAAAAVSVLGLGASLGADNIVPELGDASIPKLKTAWRLK